jgi:ribonuclease HI
VNVFTGGSSYSHPRRGGIAYRIVTVDAAGDEVIQDVAPQGYRSATNQQMELMACIAALRDLGGRHPSVDVQPFSKVVIHTDSLYVVDNYYAAQFVWPGNGWMTRDGNPVINAALWKDLVKAARKVGKRVDIVWCKGHAAGNPHNKAVDKLAKSSAKGVLRDPLNVSRVRRKETSKVTEIGSIRAEGQLVTIRVITDTYLRPQRMYVYKCEVVSERSRYFGNVDNLFSEILLNAGHVYVVRLNDDPKRPRIVECCMEVEAPAR